MIRALEACGAPVVASFVLAGGVLTGKYDKEPNVGRAAAEVGDRRFAGAVAAARQLGDLARALDTTPAALAIAFAVASPAVASVLFGATSADQLRANAAALALVERLGDDDLVAPRAIGT